MISINKVYHGDCLEIMRDIDEKSIDMILCDLPYEKTARNHWDKRIDLVELWENYERIIKDNGVICLTAIEPFSSELVLSNLKLFRYDLIWEKPLGTGFLNANRMPLRSHEQILIFYKKLPIFNPQKEPGIPYKLTQRSLSTNYNESKSNWETNNETGERYPKSVLKFSYDKEKYHPTQKPVKLFEWLIKTYTNEGDLVLDNAAGSGTTAIACIRNKRNYILIEKDEYYCSIIQKRIEEEVKNALQHP